jgi:hypothetical protein
VTTRSGLAIALVLAASGGELEAAPIPETALSQSLQVRSELLRDEASQYLFPQLAAGTPSALFGFGASAEQSVAGAGVRGTLDASSLSFLTQSSVPFATASGQSGPTWQVGWARRAGGLRLGVSYAWSVLGDRSRQKVVFGREDSAASTFLTLAHHQASLGFGWGDDDASIDLVAELRWERLDYQRREVENRTAPYFRLLDEVRTKIEGDLMPGVAVRAHAPLGSRARLVGFGSFRETTFDVAQSRHLEIVGLGGSVEEETSETSQDTGQSWSTGALLEVGERSRLALHGFWESMREPARHDPTPDSLPRTRTEIEALRIGVSGAHELAEATTLHAGWSMTDRREIQVQDVVFFFPGTQVQGEQDHFVSHDFGWGATHTFWLLDLTGSATHDLSLGALFLRLDLRARF